jgi:hypothetical protein
MLGVRAVASFCSQHAFQAGRFREHCGVMKREMVAKFCYTEIVGW